jgi:hypothetical protein
MSEFAEWEAFYLIVGAAAGALTGRFLATGCPT